MFKPMLAATYDSSRALSFPVLASPKLDGIRAIVRNGVLVSRALKPIPNKHIQAVFRGIQDGLDGELVVGSPVAKDCFRATTHSVMSHDGEPDARFFVFDVCSSPAEPYSARYASINPHESRICVVDQVQINSEEELLEFENTVLGLGYEGVIVRSASASYKHGRSTLKEQGLVKIKRFKDSEAVILSVNPLYHNENTATTDALGHTVRSSHKDNKVLALTMGSLTVRDTVSGIEFDVGTGFTQADREYFWEHKEDTGTLIKYKYFDIGCKTKPRFPTFLGIRSALDMDSSENK